MSSSMISITSAIVNLSDAQKVNQLSHALSEAMFMLNKGEQTEVVSSTLDNLERMQRQILADAGSRKQSR